jgi:hypothetical protein
MFDPVHHWLVDLGDPTIAGWACVAGYFTAAVLCWRASRLKEPELHRTNRWFWAGILIVMVGFGINKQLDVQTLVIGELRAMFSENNAWNHRHTLAQLLAIVVVAAVGSAGYWLRPDARPLRAALVATVLLIAVSLARAVPGPIHDVLVVHIAGPQTGIFHSHVKEVVELTLASTIAASAGATFNSGNR